MRFRPCIDIHNGKVKQIIGSTLSDDGGARENFVSPRGAAFFARFYRKEDLPGGHLIILNKAGTPEYEASLEQARGALAAYPGGLMIGGGITDANAASFIEMGASHVIVSSFAFSDGLIREDNLQKLLKACGREHICLDLSVKKKNSQYYIVTDRWQKFTEQILSVELLERLSDYCDEYLIHATDVEGKRSGMDEQLIEILANYEGNPVTYAGGVGSYDDIDRLRELSGGRIDVTIGSALDLFGGPLEYDRIMERIQAEDSFVTEE